MSQVILRPNGVGEYQEWETIVDTSHWGATSDETDATYIETIGGLDKRDIQALQDPTFGEGDTINWVQVFCRAYAIGSGAKERLAFLERQNTSERDEGNIAITRNSWNEYSGIQNVNAPDGGNWTKAKVTALQAGIRVSASGGTETLRVSEIWVLVDYTEAPTKVTQYLPGNDCPEFPHETDLLSDKLPCPPPY